ncbi:DUF3868 domain-containing protein [Porphyromonas pogonae]|uniref:DUF3868 domain-containing protein n=1 Tax=Porphyromonas pogonae TaxID=867595 RepID=UPI002E78E4C9|nr:DUF3868 domain-containing protein [Porphyromonas pogonae]
MKHTLHNILHILLLYIVIVGGAKAQTAGRNFYNPSPKPVAAVQTRELSPRTSMPELRFQEVHNYFRGDSLHINFKLVIRGAIINSGDALHIIPVYRVGGVELRFPEVLVNGKRRAAYYRREQALLSHSAFWEQKPYVVVSVPTRVGDVQSVSYRVSLPLTKPINLGGKLTFDQLIEDCCDWHLMGVQPSDIEGSQAQADAPRSSKPSVTPPVYESSVTFIRPKKEVVKERNEHLSLHINYIVDRYDILPYYASNAEELAKVDNVLRPLSSRRETYRIRSASIKGYASPEAPYDYNLKLSQRRADGFKQYLIRKYGLYDISMFPATGMGEDWEGLRAAVEESDMMYRDAVLTIIDGVDIFKGREKLLMDLAGGVPYKYMLYNLYPPLRRMEMEVSYTVRSFETVEAEEVLKQRPQDLSQEEIYEVARRRNSGDKSQRAAKDYGREYDVAAKYFPNDAVANINAASAALVRGDLDGAWKYLGKVQNVPEAYNNLGVYYWMRGDLSRARDYFRRALKVKGEESRAKYNLEQLEESLQNKGGMVDSSFR